MGGARATAGKAVIARGGSAIMATLTPRAVDFIDPAPTQIVTKVEVGDRSDEA